MQVKIFLGAPSESLFSQSVAQNNFAFVVDPNVERAAAARQKISALSLLPTDRLQWLEGLDADQIQSRFLAALKEPNLAFVCKNHQFVSSKNLSPDLETQIQNEWSLAIAQLNVLFGNPKDSFAGVQNTFQNIKWIESHPGVLELKDRFKGVPAIGVAAGPSLNKSLPMLRDLQERALIISSDASLKILLENQITPDFVFAIERDQHSMPFFKGIQIPAQTELIAYPLVPSAVLNEFKGRQRVAYRDYGWFVEIEKSIPRGILPSESSVMHMICRAAASWGCSEICLVGQDLAFDPQTRATHAKGIAYSEWSNQRSQEQLEELMKERGDGKFLSLPGNLEPEVPTSVWYYLFAKQFQLLAQGLEMPVINCTEGGLKIPHILWMRLEERSKFWSAQSSQELHNWRSKAETVIPASRDSFDLQGLQSWATQMTTKLESISQALGQLPRDEEAQTQVLKILRDLRANLYRDERFVAWILQNAGSKLFEIENQISGTQDVHGGYRQWLEHMKDCCRQFLNCFNAK